MDAFVEEDVQAIFAGQRSAFAYTGIVANPMAGFMKEFTRLNEEEKAEPLPPGVNEITTTDGKSFLVN